VNVLEEALPIPTNNKTRGLEINPKHRSYNFENLTMLVQTSFKICVFYKVKRHVVIECPLINSEVKDGFVRYVGQ